MLEATRQFFMDAMNFSLPESKMLDILQSLTGLNDQMPLGLAIYEFHALRPAERNYISCVLLERDQDTILWHHEWDSMEQEAFE